MYTPPRTKVSDEENNGCLRQLPKKKIALIISNLCLFRGTQRVTAILSDDLANYFDVTIITFWQDRELAFNIDKRINIYNLYNKPKRFRYVFSNTVSSICKILAKDNIDVLLVIGRNNGIVPLIVRLFSRTKLIYCEHNSVHAYKFQNLSLRQKLFNWLLQKSLCKIPDYVVTLTEKDLNYYKDKSVPHTSIYNSLDDSLVQIRNQYNNSSRKIITVASIHVQKGLEYLVDVAEKVLTKHPDWEWHVWGGHGTDEYTKKIKDLIKVKGLEDKLILKGINNKIYEIYKEYSLQVMTSRFEGLPMVLLEGKTNNLPIVSFDIDAGPSDIVRDGIDGYLIKPFDTEAMADAICYLIENEDVRLKFSNNARGNLDKFDRRKITQQWVDLINSL